MRHMKHSFRRSVDDSAFKAAVKVRAVGKAGARKDLRPFQHVNYVLPQLGTCLDEYQAINAG
jgi:hypothetical protein